MNRGFAIVHFEHLSLSGAHPQFAQCKMFLSIFNGKAALHLQYRQVGTFSLHQLGMKLCSAGYQSAVHHSAVLKTVFALSKTGGEA